MSLDEPGSRSHRAFNARIFDVLVALFLLAISLSVLVSLVSDEGNRYLWLVIPLLVAHSGSLVWRRDAPMLVWGINLASGGAVLALGYPVVTLGVSVLVALYSVALLCERRRSLVAAGITVAAMLVTLANIDSGGDASTIAGNAVVLAVAWFLGDSQRERRAYVTKLEQRTAELERARHELARSAVAEERLRIARELHDVVAHNMGMIAVQAGAGAHVIDTRPEEAKRSLETILQASRSALGEIRGMLGLLRSSEDPAETDPSPGLAELSRLAEEVRQAGVEVELDVDEPLEQLPDAFQLTIFRIVQEALTNTVKHAGASRVRVSVRFAEDGARVDVVDDGGGKTPIGSDGHGIIGMRERVTMHGGRLDASRLPEGGFRVTAEIPMGERAR
jgi:signal transduction histidine kinase